jgi:polysaccharide export outer membrane protein
LPCVSLSASVSKAVVSKNNMHRRKKKWSLALAVLALQIGSLSPARTEQVEPGTPSSDQYLIGVGDTLQVFVWRNPELSVTVPVRPDGKISTPLVDNAEAVGKTPLQLAHDIEVALSEYVRSPKVNIIVTQPLSNFSQVKVVGQVTHPLSVAYRDGMTVLDVVLAAGGLGQFAAGNRAKIVRIENGKQIQIPVKLVRLVEKGDLRQNFPLRPGDVLVVPQALF